jgi:CMP-N,N'-diacetyllegionaminic acid synthase
MSQSRILAVIPARGGSKGVPGKNIRPLAGKPLIAWTIEVARAASELLTRVIVSTDDPEIAEVARGCGAEVPFIRPPELSHDRAPMVPVVQHCVQFAEAQSGSFAWVMLLQPTAPLRTAQDIREAVRLSQSGGCDSVISVVQVFAVHPMLMKRIEGDRLLPFCLDEPEGTRRQDYQPPAYMRNGAIYLSRRDVIMQRSSIWGDVIRPYVMPEQRSTSIDNEVDFQVCESMMASRLIRKG